MILAAQALEVAHRAIAGKQYADAPCDISIGREGRVYTVTFSKPKGPDARGATQVMVDGESGSVREVRDAAEARQDPKVRGFISGMRAFEIGLAKIRELAIPHDERWETTVVLRGDKYFVTFPVPEADRAASRRADYALQVIVNAKNASVIEMRAAS